MKAFKILKHIEVNAIDNCAYISFNYSSMETSVEFVKRYFGGTSSLEH